MIGWVIAAAAMLLSHHQADPPQPVLFRQVVDLSQAVNVSAGTPQWQRPATSIDTPGKVVNGRWQAEQVPPERLAAPLVVLDVRARAAQDPHYEVSVDDIARWERANGRVPAGSVVVAHTGWETRQEQPKSPHPGFSPGAVQFLVEGRVVYGVGIDAPSVDARARVRVSPLRYYMAAKRVFALENVANLDRTPAAGALVMIAPGRAENNAPAPVTLIALVR